MPIRAAGTEDFETVKTITQKTIEAIYPHYYPAGAVQFFQHHHSDESIRRDIEGGKVFLLLDEDQYVGTVTVSENEINRLFVLPQQQGKGFGRSLMDFAEQAVFQKYDTCILDASLPAKAIYQKRGFSSTAYHTIRTENGDYLCYDVMEKQNPER